MNIEQLALYYINTPAYEVPSNVKTAFRQFVVDVAQVELQGINFQFVDFQPYNTNNYLSLDDIKDDFNQGQLMISHQFNQSDLLGPEVNLIYRCIHETHHVKLNVDFGWEGECKTATYLMAFTENLLFQQIIFSEVIGQVAVCLYEGQFPRHQKVVLFEPEIVRSFCSFRRS